MNLNCDTFIKQEFLNAEEELADLNIPIKNEPIFDECISSLTVKSEPTLEEIFQEGVLSIKTENSLQNQEIETEGTGSFLIYELETPPATQISNGTHPSTPKIYVSNTNQTKISNTDKPPLVSESNHNHVTVRTVTASPPILLNAQLRKRHKVILPVNPIDKRTRYNIQGITPLLLDKTCVAANPTKTCNANRSINTESKKKIINHLIKNKRNLRKPEESPSITKKFDNQDTINTVASALREESLTSVCSNHFNKTTANAQIQTHFIDTVSPNLSAPLSINQNPFNSAKQSADSPIISELRVKCLCSLTDDTTNDNAELKTFFKEMYEETRRLNKTQQRKVKMLLLKAICDAEELMEQGKCCGF